MSKLDVSSPNTDSAPLVRVGLNGFGRIGRAVFRINALQPRFRIVAVNDIDPDIDNHSYLLRFDSTYGRFSGSVAARRGENRMVVDGEAVAFYAQPGMADVPWENHDIDIVIDASGVFENVLAARELVESGRVRKVVVTHSPRQGVDETIVFGVNEAAYDAERHHVVSTSICDANASGPVLRALADTFGIESGYITTLHPWLSYQNLVDGSVRSVSSPGHVWQDYSLGRASTMSLIPKNTTLVGALARVLPEVAECIDAISFRVPTGIVSASDLTIQLRTPATAADVNALFRSESAQRPRIFGYEEEHLVSVDHAGTEQSVVVDSRWTRSTARGSVKMVVWYDNEWGYSQRVVDMAATMAARLDSAAPAAASMSR